MKHLSLFNGIGGFQLAAYWCGWDNVVHVEIEDFCNKPVARHFPESKCYTDIKEFDGAEYRGQIDIISGGFPCQPYSLAGKRLGKKDDRALWPEMLRVIKEIRPTWICGENVAGIRSLFQYYYELEMADRLYPTPEDARVAIAGSDRQRDGENSLYVVVEDLAQIGYEVQPFVIPACAVNAPHRRDRVWIVGYSERCGRERITWGRAGQEPEDRYMEAERDVADTSNNVHTDRLDSGRDKEKARGSKKEYQLQTGRHENGKRVRVEFGECFKDDSDTISERLQGGICRQFKNLSCKNESSERCDYCGILATGKQWQEHWIEAATRLCRVDDGLPRKMDRGKRLRALGNAIVPQVVYQIFKAINKAQSRPSWQITER